MTVDMIALENRYRFLDNCPACVLGIVVTWPDGDLSDRVAGARAWQDALARGELPSVDTWPRDPVSVPVRKALTELGVLPFLVGQDELVDQVLVDVFASFGRQDAAFRREVSDKLRELEALERHTRAALLGKGQGRNRTRSAEIDLDRATLRRLFDEATDLARLQSWNADARLISEWQQRVTTWRQISDVFGDLGELLGRGADLSQGVLRHTGWKDLIALAKLLASLDEIREIIKVLGRLREGDSADTVSEQLFLPMLRLEEERVRIQTPHVPEEMRGVERGDNIARMLPAEAAMLGHPTLRLLWHARRIERALLTYRVQGTEWERRIVEKEVQVAEERRKPRPDRGPIVAVVDTSGSMRGLPERVSKALVFEAMRVAHREKRSCYLYGYSGPGQVVEQELDLSHSGIGRLLQFLGMSFGGGTDIGAMRAVVKRLDDDSWRKADVLLVTDGEWWAPPQVVEAVGRARDSHGTRFHGVLVGQCHSEGISALCNPVHVVTNWDKFGG